MCHETRLSHQARATGPRESSPFFFFFLARLPLCWSPFSASWSTISPSRVEAFPVYFIILFFLNSNFGANPQILYTLLYHNIVIRKFEFCNVSFFTRNTVGFLKKPQNLKRKKKPNPVYKTYSVFQSAN